VKIAQGIGYASAGGYIPDFGQISVKISVFGVLYPSGCTDGYETWHREGSVEI